MKGVTSRTRETSQRLLIAPMEIAGRVTPSAKVYGEDTGKGALHLQEGEQWRKQGTSAKGAKKNASSTRGLAAGNVTAVAIGHTGIKRTSKLRPRKIRTECEQSTYQTYREWRGRECKKKIDAHHLPAGGNKLKENQRLKE